MVILSYLSKWYSILALRIPFFKYLTFIGIFTHEFSHYLMCKLTGAKVGRFQVKLHHGYVAHGKSKLPIIGKMMISLAPFFVGLILLVILVITITNTSLAEFNNLAKSINIDNFNNEILSLIKKVEINLWFFLWLYLFLNLLITFVPSKRDLKNIILGLVLYFLIAGFFLPGLNQFLMFSLILAIIFVIIGLLMVVLFNIIQLIIIKPFK